MDDDCTPCYSLTVPRRLVKTIKDALQSHQLLDKSSRIKKIEENDESYHEMGIVKYPGHCQYLIPTTLPYNADAVSDASMRTSEARTKLLEALGLPFDGQDLNVVVTKRRSTHGSKCLEMGKDNGSSVASLQNEEPASPDIKTISRLKNSLRANHSKQRFVRVMIEWLNQLLQEVDNPSSEHALGDTGVIEGLVRSNVTYLIYSPLLLLQNLPLSNYLGASDSTILKDHLPSLYELLCKHFRVTHIALNAPIPGYVSSVVTKKDETSQTHGLIPKVKETPNILRSPTGLTPLYGDFGPHLPPGHTPTSKDISSAFWCTARQNGIYQTWAPRYTMFSRGNVSEKARILKLRSLTEEGLGCTAKDTSAVDLYAGIGYFAFSYVKAGVGQVLCWEFNAWSVEGLRRGALGNKWSAGIVHTDDASQPVENIKEVECETRNGGRLRIFQENNKFAPKRVDALRKTIPPIRHVNCGFLPTSKECWETAVRVLDPIGGWIHAHENIAVKDTSQRKTEIVEVFAQLVAERYGQEPEERRRVECEHLERVKHYAPGVDHCVLDIAISLAK